MDGDDDGGHAAKVPKVRDVDPLFFVRAWLLTRPLHARSQHRRKKDRNAPKRPRNAYLVFLDRHRPAKQTANPTAAMKARPAATTLQAGCTHLTRTCRRT